MSLEICSTPHGGLDISTTQMANQNIILHSPYPFAYNLHMVDHSYALLGSIGFLSSFLGYKLDQEYNEQPSLPCFLVT